MSVGRFFEAGRFLSVGVANTFLGLSIIYAANVLGYSVGLSLSFSLNSRWTFAYCGPHLPALIKFLLVTLVAYAANLAVVLVAIHYFDANAYLSQASGVVPYTLISYLASRYLVFCNTI